jgi:transcriptional regulator with XRE-family HTH domain
MTLETANRLYELRKKSNLSQEELAEKLGVSRQAVSKWERSEASPDTDNLIALAKIYGLSLDELIYGEKEDKKEEKKKENEENSEAKTEDDNLFIDIDNGEEKVKIGPKGIVVEDDDGERVKISFNGITITTSKSDCEDEQCDDDDDDDGDDGELYETVYSSSRETKNGDKVRVKVKRPTRFWLEVPYPIICALAYLIFGFYDICGGWALSWIIFVTIPVYYTFVEAIYKKRFAEFCYPVFCACVYLYLGMYQGNWHPSWLIFVTVPIYYPIADALDKMIRNR